MFIHCPTYLSSTIFQLPQIVPHAWVHHLSHLCDFAHCPTSINHTSFNWIFELSTIPYSIHCPTSPNHPTLLRFIHFFNFPTSIHCSIFQSLYIVWFWLLKKLLSIRFIPFMQNIIVESMHQMFFNKMLQLQV